MLIKDYLIAVVLFGFAIVAAALMTSDLASYYNVNINSSFNETYGTLNAMKTTSEKLQGAIAGKTIAPGGFFGVILYGIGSFFLLIINSITIPAKIAVKAAHEFGIPAFIPITIITLIIIGIIVAIVSAAMRKTI